MEPLDEDPPTPSKLCPLIISVVAEISTGEHKVLWDVVSSSNHLSNAEKELLYALLSEYADVFGLHPDDLGRTDLIKHHIDTGDSQPIHQLPHRVSPAHRQEVKQLLDEMLKMTSFNHLTAFGRHLLYWYIRGMEPHDSVLTTEKLML